MINFNIFDIKENYRRSILVMLLAVCFIGTYYSHYNLRISMYYTNLFYIPIVLASLWWRYKGIIVPIILALFIFLINISHVLSC